MDYIVSKLCLYFPETILSDNTAVLLSFLCFSYILQDTQFSIFDLYPNEEKFVDGKIISVNENFRGLGIAGKLTDKVIEFMQHDKINLFHVLCTSHYSARVMEKMNFHEVYNLPFEDFLVDGEQLLCPAKPHVSARILVKEVLK